MATEPRIVNIELALDLKDQTRDHVHKALDAILERFNCYGCGLMAVLAARAVPNPTPSQKT